MSKATLRIAATLLFGTVAALGILQLSAAPAEAGPGGRGACVRACIASGNGPASCMRSCR